MARYIFLNNDLEHYICGSDCLLYCDGRLSDRNKVIKAKGVIKNLLNVKPNFKPTYIGRYNLRGTPTNILKL